MSHVEGNNGKSVDIPVARTVVVHISDNSELIRRLKRTTLVGRIMNPKAQSIGSLLLMMPKLWRLEARVVGKDLGSGLFRLDFEREEDILEVMQMEPFSFNHWMVSIVRWEPIIHQNYPTAITFWVRIVGVTPHFWTDENFQRIGRELGMVREVDEDNGMVQVTIDGFTPLCFEMPIQFEKGGDEVVVVKMEYEKLFGYSGSCFSLRHDEESCPQRDLHNHVLAEDEE